MSPTARRALVVVAAVLGAPVGFTRLTGCLFPDYQADLQGYDCTREDDTSVHCANVAPDGWSGPVGLGDDGGCPELLVPAAGAQLYFEAPTHAPAECTPCSCSAEGVLCVFDEVELFGNETCSSDCGVVLDEPTKNGCFKFLDAGACTHARARAKLAPKTAGCAPAGGIAEKPPAFDRRVALCSPRTDAGTGCAGSTSCAPVEASCYYIPGPAECAAGQTKHMLYAKLDHDDRGCSDCSCGTHCAGIVHKSQGSCTSLDCDDTEATFPITAACADLGMPSTGLAFIYCDEPQCAPDGGQPIGDASFSDEVTVCCPAL